MAVLLLRLCGPMQSWGVQSRFTNRDTALEPSKSGVIGLVCAALGKPRDEDVPPPPGHPGWPPLSQLAALKMGVRVDRPGQVMRDYQTAGGWRGKEGGGYGVPTADNTSRRTIVSERFYLADALFLVGLQGEEDLLERIYHALQQPVWQLYLGRKSFVPSCPIWLSDGFYPDSDDLSAGDELRCRLASYPYFCQAKKDPPDVLRLEIEVDYGQGDIVRPDQPVSFVSAMREHSLRHVVVEELQRKDLPPAKEELCICPC